MKSKANSGKTVALVGRPNVGKSTLFNRLVGKRLALVHPRPGVTRDVREETTTVAGLRVRLFDTAGYQGDSDAELAQQIDAATSNIIQEADLCVMLMDSRVGLLPHDEEFARLLRQRHKPSLLVVNKAETDHAAQAAYEAAALGMGEVFAISAEHGSGVGVLCAQIRRILEDMAASSAAASEHGIAGAAPPTAESDEQAGYAEDPLRVSIIGRPNRGKSTLANRLFGEERMLVGERPGVTRDTLGHLFTWKGRRIKLYDTAGIRRRSAVSDRLEQLTVSQSLRAVRFAELVVLLVEATAPLERQELTLARRVIDEGRALVIGLSKADIARAGILEEVRAGLRSSLAQVGDVPVVMFSALRGSGTDKLMDEVLRVSDIWNQRIATGQLNRWLRETVEAHPPPAVNGRRPNLKFITQSKSRPPTFVIMCQRPDAVDGSYRRYLTSRLQARYGFVGVPIRLVLRARDNPYA